MEDGAWSTGNQYGNWKKIQKWYNFKKWSPQRLIHFDAKE
jgi:hypothetical protein